MDQVLHASLKEILDQSTSPGIPFKTHNTICE